MEGPYHLPKDVTKQFSMSEISDLTKIFKTYDTDSNGTMNRSELHALLHNLGHRDVTQDEVSSLLAQIDLDADEKINFLEFVKFLTKLTKDDLSPKKSQNVKT